MSRSNIELIQFSRIFDDFLADLHAFTLLQRNFTKQSQAIILFRHMLDEVGELKTSIDTRIQEYGEEEEEEEGSREGAVGGGGVGKIKLITFKLTI